MEHICELSNTNHRDLLAMAGIYFEGFLSFPELYNKNNKTVQQRNRTN